MVAWNIQYDIRKNIMDHPVRAVVRNNPADLVAWFDTDKGIILNGADVSQWDDQSGNGNNLIQGTAANQPLFNTADSNFNGMPSLTFDGVSEFLSASPFSTAISQPNTVFCVFRWNITTGQQFILDGETGAQRNSLMSNTIGSQIALFAGTAVVNVQTRDLNAHVISALFNGASSDTFLDGIQGTPASTPGSNPLGQIRVGIAENDLNLYNGDLAALIIYNKNLNTTEKNLVGNYLATKYGTTWTDI